MISNHPISYAIYIKIEKPNPPITALGIEYFQNTLYLLTIHVPSIKRMTPKAANVIISNSINKISSP